MASLTYDSLDLLLVAFWCVLLVVDHPLFRFQPCAPVAERAVFAVVTEVARHTCSAILRVLAVITLVTVRAECAISAVCCGVAACASLTIR